MPKHQTQSKKWWLPVPYFTGVLAPTKEADMAKCKGKKKKGGK